MTLFALTKRSPAVKTKSSFLLTFLFLAQSAWSGTIPDCQDYDGSTLPIDNATPLTWKKKQANGWQTRSHIDGHFVKETVSNKSHYKFTIQIGPDARDTIEVVYNKGFGNYPAVFPGMKVEACGVFINAFAQFGRYPPSPDGAIIHWVHKNPKYKPGSEPHGYIVMDGKLVGFGNTR